MSDKTVMIGKKFEYRACKGIFICYIDESVKQSEYEANFAGDGSDKASVCDDCFNIIRATFPWLNLASYAEEQ